MEPDVARGRVGATAACANLPASASGGGARNLVVGWTGGDGSRGGEFCSGGEAATSVRVLRDGGGAGGGPLRLAVVEPVFCGLIEFILDAPGGAAGGGGGGGAFPLRSLTFASTSPPPFAACLCSI